MDDKRTNNNTTKWYNDVVHLTLHICLMFALNLNCFLATIKQGTGSIPSIPQRDAGDNAFPNGGHQQQSVPLGHVTTAALHNSSPKEQPQDPMLHLDIKIVN